MASFWEVFSGKRFKRLGTHRTIVYVLCNTVGRSIPFIYDFSGIFTSVAYIGYGPPYRTIYINYLYNYIYNMFIKL